MKLAVAAYNAKAESEISEQAGRAPYYLIFENGALVEAWKNPFAVGGGGAGWGVAKVLAAKGVKKVIAGRFGGNMQTALADYGIEAVEHHGKVEELF